MKKRLDYFMQYLNIDKDERYIKDQYKYMTI